MRCWSQKIRYETKHTQMINEALSISIPIKTLRHLIQNYAIIICIFSEPEKPIMELCNFDNIIQINATTRLISKNRTLFLWDLLTNVKEKLQYQNWSLSFGHKFIKDRDDPSNGVFIITENFNAGKNIKKIVRFDLQTKQLQIIYRSIYCHLFYFLTHNRILFYPYFHKIVIYNWMLNTYHRYELPYIVTSFLSASDNQMTCCFNNQINVLDLITSQWNKTYDYNLLKIVHTNEKHYLPDNCIFLNRVHLTDVHYWTYSWNRELFERENIFYWIKSVFGNKLYLHTSKKSLPIKVDIPIKDNYSCYKNSIILNHDMICIKMMRADGLPSKRIYIINFIENKLLFQIDLSETESIKYKNDILIIAQNIEIHDRQYIEISKYILELPKQKL